MPESGAAGKLLRDPAVRRSPGFSRLAALWGPLGSLLFHLPLYLPGRSAGFRDLASTHEPLRTLASRAWLAGQVPHWNPFPDGGTPLLANPNSGTLHPSLLTALWLPPAPALTLAVVLQQALAALAVFGLVRQRGCSPAASAAASLAWAGAGPMLSVGTVLNQLNGFAWAPVAAWTCGKALRTGGFWVPAAALAWAAVLVAGAPLAVGTAVALTLVAALPAFGESQPDRRPRRRMFRLAAVWTGGLALAAPALVPTTLLLGRAERAAGFPAELSGLWSLHPARLLEMLVPMPMGHPASIGPPAWIGSGAYEGGLPILLSVYLGAPVLLLAFLGLRWARRDPAVLVLALLAAGSILLALGRHAPFHAWLLALPGVPPLRYPSKFLVPATAALSLLVAYGWEEMARRPGTSGRSRLWSLLAVLAAAMLILLFLAPVGTGPLPGVVSRLTGLDGEAVGPASGWLHGRIVLALGFLALACLAPLAVTSRPRWGARYLGAILAASLLVGAWGWSGGRPDLVAHPSVPSGTLNEGLPVYRQALAGAGVPPGRLFRPRRGPGAGLQAPTGRREEIYLRSRWTLQHHAAGRAGVGTVLELQPDRMGLYGPAALRSWVTRQDPRTQVRVARRLGAAVVESLDGFPWPGLEVRASFDALAHPGLRLEALTDPLPPARVVGSAWRVSDERAGLDRFRSPDGDPAGEVILDSPHEGREGVVGPAGEARMWRQGLSALRVEVEADRSGWLVLTENYDEGWQAWIDGRPVEVLRGDLILLALPVPEGHHRIVLAYRSPGWRFGLGVAAAGLVTLLGLSLIDRRQRA